MRTDWTDSDPGFIKKLQKMTTRELMGHAIRILKSSSAQIRRIEQDVDILAKALGVKSDELLLEEIGAKKKRKKG